MGSNTSERNDCNRCVLMIAYLYPPILSVGRNRTVRFAENLTANGYEPIVHTVRNPDRSLVPVGDPNECPEYVRRSFSINLGFPLRCLNWAFDKVAKLFGKNVRRNPIQRLCIPDAHIGWIPGCLFYSLWIIRQKKPSHIYVSCSPFSSAITGVLLKRITGLPLVLDFRDPWSFNDHNLNLGVVSGGLRRIESWAVKHTDLLIVNTETTADKYQELYPEWSRKITFLYNGFTGSGQPEQSDPGKFKLVYCGAFYGEQYLDWVFEAVSELPSSDVEVVFTGIKRRTIDRVAERWGVSESVRQTGFISRDELDNHLGSASLLLFHNGFDSSGELNRYVVKSKLYDYLATGRPLLALAPPGEVSTLIQQYAPQSIIISSEYRASLITSIVSSFDHWKTVGQDPSVDSQVFRRDFSPAALTAKLAGMFDSVSACQKSVSDGGGNEAAFR